MMVRFLVLLLFVAGLFGQIGMFGRVSAHLKAGDLAPQVAFKEILQSGSASSWTSANLFGRVTVLVFYPDTTHNLESVSKWNELVDQFAQKPIQFAWVTGEDKASLMPWLRNHPMKGWLFLDPEGATSQSYGLELPAAAIIGTDGRIVGFDESMIPAASTLNAVLEDRITTDPPKLEAASLRAFDESGMVLLSAEPPRIPSPNDHKPYYAPSYTLHISPSNTRDGGYFGGEDFRSFQDVRLRDVVAALENTNPIRVVLPRTLDDGKRYNISIVLPKPESQQDINNRIRRGIEDYFHVAMVREKRLVDVYVVTTVDGTPPKTKIPTGDGQDVSGGSFSSVWVQASDAAGNPPDLFAAPMALSISQIENISMDGTMDEFCNMLELELNRPVVNETDVDGEFRFQVTANGVDKVFLERLRDELNLTVFTAQRSVEVVVLKPL